MGGVLLSICHFLTHQTFFSSRKDHEKAEFEVHEVYAVDVLVSSGEGKVSRVLPARRSPCTWLDLSTAGGADSPIRVGSRCFSLHVAFSIKKKVRADFYHQRPGPRSSLAEELLLCPLPTRLCSHFQAKDAGQRTTIYKRDPSKQYGLKMKTSRAFFSEVERRFDTMPFTLRYLLLFVTSPRVQSWILCALTAPCSRCLSWGGGQLLLLYVGVCCT